jgi:hypothetical protein
MNYTITMARRDVANTSWRMQRTLRRVRNQVGIPRGARAGFAAVGAGELGAINLRGAHIGSTLECHGASLRNDSGPALIADSLQVDQGMFLTDGFSADGSR